MTGLPVFSRRRRAARMRDVVVSITLAVGAAASHAQAGAGAGAGVPSQANLETTSLAAIALPAPASVRPPAPAPVNVRDEWNFEVLLDDTVIGSHRFIRRRDGAEARMRSDAAFDVKLFGFTVFRYRQEAEEQWRNGCLSALQSRTDNNGTPQKVDAVATEGGGLQVKAETDAARTERDVPGCLMSFAYWNPDVLRQSQLINAENGKLVPVTIAPLADAVVQLDGRAVPTRRFSLTGGEHPVVLSYSAQGDWLALESTVTGSRRLRYRLLR